MDYEPFWRYRPTDEEYLLERQRLNEAKARYCAAKKAHGPLSPEAVDTLFELAELYRMEGHFDIAEWLLDRVWFFLPYVYPADDIRSVDMLMLCAFQAERLEDALQLGMEAVERAKLITGADSVEAGYQVHNLGTLYSNHGQRDAAVKWQMAGIECLQRNLADNDAELIGILRWTASRCYMNGEYDEALSLYRELHRVSLRDNGPEDLTTLNAMQGVAGALGHLGMHQAALPLWRECSGALLNVPNESEDAVYMALKGYRDCCTALDLYDEALAAALQLLEAVGTQSNRRTSILHKIGSIYARTGDYENAISYFMAAKEDMVLHENTMYISHADLEHELADAHRALGQEQEAVETEANAAAAEKALEGLPPELLKSLEAHRLGLPDPIRTIEPPLLRIKRDN